MSAKSWIITTTYVVNRMKNGIEKIGQVAVSCRGFRLVESGFYFVLMTTITVAIYKIR